MWNVVLKKNLECPFCLISEQQEHTERCMNLYKKNNLNCLNNHYIKLTNINYDNYLVYFKTLQTLSLIKTHYDT